MTDDILKNYSNELGLSNQMTLQSLIDSHRHLREKNKISHQDWLHELEKAREFGRKQGFDMITNGQYIEVSKLKNMTVAQLIEFIGCEE